MEAILYNEEAFECHALCCVRATALWGHRVRRSRGVRVQISFLEALTFSGLGEFRDMFHGME